MTDAGKHLAAALPDRQERLRLLADELSGRAIIFLSSTGTLASWSRAAERITGFAASEVVGRPFASLFTLEDQRTGLPQALLDRAAASGFACDVGYRMRKRGGRLWGEIVVLAFAEESGDRGGFACVMRDISERKYAEDMQRAHVERLNAVIRMQTELAHAELDPAVLIPLALEHAQALTEATCAAVASLEDGTLKYFAAAGRETTGSVRAPLSGSLAEESVRTGRVMVSSHVEDDPGVRSLEAFCPGIQSVMIAPLQHHARTVGVLTVLSTHSMAFTDRHASTVQLIAGILGAALSNASSFVEQKRAEAEAEAQAGRLSAVLAAATEISIIGTDLQGRLIFFSKGAERMLGYTSEEVIGRSPYIFHDPDEIQARLEQTGGSHRELFLGRAEYGEPHTAEWTYLRKDGSPLRVFLTFTPLRDETGKVVGIVSVGIDITERKAIEQMKDEFISIVSHELRTPLTAIRGSLGLMANGLLGALPERAAHMVDIALANTDRLVRLVSDMLDLERIKSGKSPLHMQKCNLGDLMQQATEVMRSKAAQAGVQIDAQPVHTTICADPDRIVQVLTNLLDNATKFSESGSRVQLNGGLDVEVVRVQVRDRGRGIPSDLLERIFDPFEQVDSSDSRAKGGSGLGLAICRMIVEQHSGRIWASSSPDEGTVISLELPLRSSRCD
jgi:PAS domain S-box-containing protein